jgi:ERCC4-type nuclease
MILVDDRERPNRQAGSTKEVLPILVRLGKPAFKQRLGFGDFCFEGNGPGGRINIGIERKTLHDMLHCIDDAHYAGHQRGGMKLLYRFSFLALEGLWKPHHPDGWLMEGWGTSWGYCKYRSQTPLYTKLFNYLVSVALSGIPVVVSRDMEQTAANVCGLYDYFQKPWSNHTSLLETQVMPLAGITGRPSLVRRWASQLEGVGVKLSENAESVFHTGIELATADETEWVRIHGISPRMARRAVGEIRGQL